MARVDADTLGEMQTTLSRIDSDRAALGSLAARLLQLRDALSFEDAAWFHALTQQIVTLDSGSTFVARDREGEIQARAAVTTATNELARLLSQKLAELNL